MNKLAKFFQETNGTFSPKRLAFLVWIFGVLIGWGFDTVHHEYKMAEIPQLGQVLIAVLMTGKVAQNLVRKIQILVLPQFKSLRRNGN